MSNDLISREWLEDAFDNLCCHNCKMCRNFRIEDSFYKCALIDNAPTVNTTFREVVAYECGQKSVEERPKGKWIPVTERLPEEDGQYLITVKYKHVDDRYEDIYAEHGEWSDGRWDMFCFGHCGEVEEIIAWMPLPEPYKRGEV